MWDGMGFSGGRCEIPIHRLKTSVCLSQTDGAYFPSKGVFSLE